MSTVTFRVRVLSVCMHWNFQIIWTVFQIDVNFQMHIRVKYSALTFQTITPLSMRIATSQGIISEPVWCSGMCESFKWTSIVVAELFCIYFFLHVGYRTVLFFFPWIASPFTCIFLSFQQVCFCSAKGDTPLDPHVSSFSFNCKSVFISFSFLLHVGYRTVLCFSLHSKSFYLYFFKLLASLFLQR